jgi:hypothetical protein
MVEKIELLAREQHRNVYIPLAVFDPNLPRGRKGGEQQVVTSLGLVADFDDSDAANYAARMPVSANYVIETSTGRFQAFLLFQEPIDPGRAKHVADLLKDCTGCDHGTADISHVWRVGGTLNWPNKKKVDQGRSASPQTVDVVKRWDDSLTAFETLEGELNSWDHRKAAEENREKRLADHGRAGSGGHCAEDSIPPDLLKLIRDGVEQDVGQPSSSGL